MHDFSLRLAHRFLALLAHQGAGLVSFLKTSQYEFGVHASKARILSPAIAVHGL